MIDFEKELAAARMKLLDLTGRNRLLNHRPRKERSIRIVDELAREVYGMLVLGERNMDFLPAVSGKNELTDSTNGDFSAEDNSTALDIDADLNEEEKSALWQAPSIDEEIAERHLDRHLQTNLEQQKLQKRLFMISKEAQAVFEEQGYTVLYLALGFLEWTEADSSEKVRRAPLVLIPVELTRTKVAAAFRVSWTGEDIYTNISLQAKLQEQRIFLPDFEMPEDKAGIDDYFLSVQESIAEKPEWKLLPDIYLDFFSFTKFVMYKDLDPDAWPEDQSPADHELIRKILDPSLNQDREKQGFSEDTIDNALDPITVFHVMDADPSQIGVIEDIKSGMDLAVEGPPGTGKSQTITNVIAELLANGKKVLFVSEKMAALEVVKNRLDSAGVGDFCLELHSRKANKKDLLSELERCIKESPPSAISLGEERRTFCSLREKLNEYTEILRKDVGKSGLKVCDLLAWKEQAHQHFGDKSFPSPLLANSPEIDKTLLDDVKHSLEALRERLELIGGPINNPWRGTNPGSVLPADELEISTAIDDALAAMDDFASSISTAESDYSLAVIDSFSAIPACLQALEVLHDAIPLPENVICNSDWASGGTEAQRLADLAIAYQSLNGTLLDKFNPDILSGNALLDRLEEFKELSCHWLRFFNGSYRYLRKSYRGWYRENPPKSNAEIISDLVALELLQRKREELQKEQDKGKNIFGDEWKGTESNIDCLKFIISWIPRFLKVKASGLFESSVFGLVSLPVETAKISNQVKSITDKECLARKAITALAERINVNWSQCFGASCEECRLDDIIRKLQVWRDSLGLIQNWSHFAMHREDILHGAAFSIIDGIDSGDIAPPDIIPIWKAMVADSLLRDAFRDNPALSGFVGELHEKNIRNFQNLDRLLIEKNRQRLASYLYDKLPSILNGSSPDSAAGILLGQINRKRGHMPIRKLLTATGNLVQKIKPCFMMSPLSIAQFLDPRAIKFDVILFDEASQVRPEDALGALLRGNQLAVFGDKKQLPPTSFFDNLTGVQEEETDEGVTALADLESILHKGSISFPSRMLKWHYRSRHESLIAVSNQEFYNNDLLVYPSVIDKCENLGLRLEYDAETVYDRGRSATNRLEARKVALAAFEHFRKHPDKSLGIGTFSTRQQKAIWEEIELLQRQNPEAEALFNSSENERFFVKNLETIQGDERDVIFISVGYGFDSAHKLSLNFGPLNQDGGERRLNVLITRAREQCVVFANFTASDLGLDSTASHGLRALKVFLGYAQTRSLEQPIETGRDADSAFEISVMRFLEGNGYEVRSQVGCAGFRIDLAVIDHKNPGRYLAGVECDGAKYHSSRVCRDRDRLRQQILEGLGWNIIRVWSTDWYRNRQQAKKRLLDQLEHIKNSGVIVKNEQNKPESSSSGTTIIRENPVTSNGLLASLEDYFAEYKSCNSLDITTDREIPDVPVAQLAKLVVRVVEVEEPVHRELIIRRIRTSWGAKRAGNRIRDSINQAVDYAANRSVIRLDGDFCYLPGMNEIKPRKRDKWPAGDFDFICDAELLEAAKLILKMQHSISREELIKQTGKALGFSLSTDKVTARLDSICDQLCDSSHCNTSPLGLLVAAES